MPARVLLVENDPNDAELVGEMLRDAVPAGLVLMHANSLAQALECLSGEDVHLVLLDLDLGDSSGLDTLARVRAATTGMVIVVSDNDDPALPGNAVRLNAYDALSKHGLRAADLHKVVRLAMRQHRTEASLHKAEQGVEARFWATFDQAAVGIAHVDLEGRIQLPNRKLCRILGYSKDDLVGRSVRELSHPDDRDATRDLCQQMHAGRIGEFTFQKRYLRKDGETVWVDLTVALVRDAEGAPRYDIAMFEDVTDSRRAQQALRETELRSQRLGNMYAALSAVNEAVFRQDDECRLFRRVCELAVEFGGLQLAAVRLTDADNGWIRTVAFAGGPAAYLERAMVSVDGSMPHTHGPSAQAVAEGRSVVSNDYLAEPRMRRWWGIAREAGIASMASVPLRRGGRVIGLISLYSGERNWFDPDLVLLVERMAANVSHALDNLERSAASRVAETKLKLSEQRFRSLTELSSDFYWESDAEHRLSRRGSAGKPSTVSLFERGAQLGERRWEIPYLSPDETGWQAHRTLLDAHLPFRNFELSRLGADGSERHISVSGDPIFDETGAFTGHRGVGTDITERKRAEQALREGEARFRSLTELSSDWFWEQDAELRMTYTSEGIDASAGVEATRLVGRRYWEYANALPVSGSWAEHRRQVEAREPYRDFEFVHFLPDGARRHLSISGQPVFDASGSFTGYRGTGRDITKARLREAELLRFRAALDLSTDSIYLVDCGSLAIVDCNEGGCRALGYTRQELVGGGAEMMFADRTRTQFRTSLVDLLSGSAQDARTEALHRRKDGSVFPVEITRRILQTEQGPILVGVARDISERRQAEARIALRARQQAGIARLGQLALGKIEPAALFDAAMRTLCEGGADAAMLFELNGSAGKYLIRAAAGAGSEAFVGRSGQAAADCHWRDLSPSTGVISADRSYLASRSGQDHSAWVSEMGSALYAVLHGDASPFGVLVVYSLRDDAFGDEDRRFAEAVSTLLSTALRRLQAEARVAFLAQFDALTDLPNRGLFNDRLGQAIAQAERHAAAVGVLFVDLDRFKLINDSLGHHAGDALIVKVAQRLQRRVRAGDTVARISGDEFAVVLCELAHADDAALVAREMLESLAAPFDLDGNEVFVTASIGIAISPSDGESAEALLQNADAAMYRAKETGRNSYCFFTAELNRRSHDKMRLATDLRRAVERREFVLHYQPKIDLGSGKVSGAEALLRWQHPERGLVPPAEFIPTLEDTGLIVPVGDWVIGEACAQLARWRDAGLAPVPVAVNLSARQFRSRELEDSIRAHLDANRIPAWLLEVEITESCLVDDPEEAVQVLGRLRAIGVRISVDDFGTGYSSLAYLTRFPLNTLKIDRAFVRNLPDDDNAAAIVRTIIDMAHTLRFTVVAEGVETASQSAFLRAHGCEQGQGFLFARPGPADEMAARLRPA